MRQAISAIALSSCICISACDVTTTTIATVERADSQASAIVEQIAGDATVSFIYRVSVLGKSNDAKPVEVLKMDHSGAPKASWRENGSLQIDAPCGNIFNFRNFVTLQHGADYEMVSIVLKNEGLCP